MEQISKKKLKHGNRKNKKDLWETEEKNDKKLIFSDFSVLNKKNYILGLSSLDFKTCLSWELFEKINRKLNQRFFSTGKSKY